MPDNVIIDATVLSTVMSCGRLGDFRFNHNLVPISGKSPSLEKGTLAHKILEYYLKARRNGASHADAIIVGLSEGRKALEELVVNLGNEDVDIVFDTMEQYFEFYKADSNSWTTIEVEHVKSALIYEDDEIRVGWKAKFDWIVDTNNGMYPVDHKTMSQRRDTLSLNNQFMGQALLMNSRGTFVNKIGFQKTLKPSEKFTRPLISYTADQLIEWSQIIVPYWAKQLVAYRKNNFYPPNYTHCENKFSICPFKEVCEANPNMREDTIRVGFKKGEPWDVQNESE